MSTFTTNKSLELPANNADVNTWDVPVNADFTAIDTALGGNVGLNAVAASGTVVLSLSQYTPPVIAVNGLLTANVNYQFPTGVGGVWIVGNGTTGAFTIAFSSGGGGTTVVIPQGFRAQIYCDGTNVNLASTIPVTPAGSDKQIQFNSSGVLSASSALTFDSTLRIVTITGGASQNPTLRISGSAGQDRKLVFQTAGVDRWWADGNGDAEGGSNTGSNFSLFACSDLGAIIYAPLVVNRQTGIATISPGLVIPGTASSQAVLATNIFETGTVNAGAFGGGTLNYYASAQSIYYSTANSSGNFTVNLSHSAGTTLNTVMTTSQTVTVTLLTTQGATPFYCNAVQVDGNAVTPKWLGGAPVAGNASGIDVYTFAVLKTGNAAFTVLASQTQFK